MSTATDQVQVPATGSLNPAIADLERVTAELRAERELATKAREALMAEGATLTAQRAQFDAQTATIETISKELEAVKRQHNSALTMEQMQAGNGERHYTGMAAVYSREAKIDRAYDLLGGTIHDIACMKAGRKRQFDVIGPYMRDGNTLAVGAQGGFVVPYPILEGISVLQEKFGIARRLCSYVKMTAHKMGKNAFGSDATVTYPNESTAPAVSQVLLRDPRGELEAKLMLVNMKYSKQLQLDAPQTLQRFHMDRLLTLAGLEEDRVFISANLNPSPWYGVLFHPDIPEITIASQSFGDITGLEIVKTLHKVSKHVRGNATWITSQDEIGVLQGLTDTQNRPLWSPMGAMQAPVIYGRSYEDTPLMPDREPVVANEKDRAFLAVGSWKDAAIFGDRMATEINFDSSVYAESQALLIQLAVDFGIYFVQPTACARARTSA